MECKLVRREGRMKLRVSRANPSSKWHCSFLLQCLYFLLGGQAGGKGMGRWPWYWVPSSVRSYCGLTPSLARELAMRQGPWHEKEKSEKRQGTVIVISIHRPGGFFTWRASTEGLFCPQTQTLLKLIICLLTFQQGKDTTQRLSFGTLTFFQILLEGFSLALLSCNWNKLQSLEKNFSFKAIHFVFTGLVKVPFAFPRADPQQHAPCFPIPPQAD